MKATEPGHAGQTRNRAAVFPYHPLCYKVDVKVGGTARYKLKTGIVINRTPLSINMFYTDAETHSTAASVNKSSLANDSSGFFFFVCVPTVC